MGLGFLLLLALAAPAVGQAVVSSGNVSLGINPLGNLSVDGGSTSANCIQEWVTMRYRPTNDEAMDCDFEGEGWGLGYDYARSGWVLGAGATMSSAGLDLVSFGSTGTTATSVTKVGDFTVTQVYQPTSVADVYEDRITLHNRATVAHDHVTYRRIMNWGSGTSGSDAVAVSIDTLPLGLPASPMPSAVVGISPFIGSSDPFSPFPTGPAPPVDRVAGDIGGAWEFDFGKIPAGRDKSFSLYYGAAEDNVTALADLLAVDADVYNIGEAQLTCVGSYCIADSKVTWLMGFTGIEVGADNEPPVALFESDADGCNVYSVILDGEGSVDPDDAVASWAWDFGDGTTGYGPRVTHRYPAAGVYRVRLTVTDTIGATATMERDVRVTDVTACPPRIRAPAYVLAPVGQEAVACATGIAGREGELSFLAIIPDGYGITFDADQACVHWTPSAIHTSSPGCVTVVVTESPGGLTARTCIRFQPIFPTLAHDSDQDGIADPEDNCPSLKNRFQEDADLDGIGDACDPLPSSHAARPVRPSGEELDDHDEDGWEDDEDLCPLVPDRQLDLDHDGVGDACDVDVDGDGVANLAPEGAYLDNCPLTPNADQAADPDDPDVGVACAPAHAPRPSAAPVASPPAPASPAAGLSVALAIGALAGLGLARRRGK